MVWAKLTLLKKNLAGSKCLVFSKIVDLYLTDDPDKLNLSSTHHDPSGKNSGLLSGSYWRPRKKNYWSLRFEPRTRVRFKERSTTKTLLSGPVQVPQEKCRFFCLATLSQHCTQLRRAPNY